MSNESTFASETTPLRPQNLQNGGTTVLNRSLLPNNSVAIANHNNNTIEVRLSTVPHSENPAEGAGVNQQNNNNNRNSSRTSLPPHISTMDSTNKRIVYRILVDFVLLICGKFLTMYMYLAVLL